MFSIGVTIFAVPVLFWFAQALNYRLKRGNLGNHFSNETPAELSPES